MHEEFISKCRDNKFIVRDFVFSEENIHTQKEELEAADVTEKELWVHLHTLSPGAVDDHLRRSFFACLELISRKRSSYWSISRFCVYLWKVYFGMAYPPTTWDWLSR